MSKQIVVGQMYFGKPNVTRYEVEPSRKVRVLEIKKNDIIGEFIGSEHLGAYCWRRESFESSYLPIVNPNKIWKELNDIHDD